MSSTSMGARVQLPTVVVSDDALTDAALIPMGEGPDLLVLRHLQTFSNAVTQVGALLPGLHPDLVRSLVRVNLPNAADFDEPVTYVPSTPRPAPPVQSRASRWGRRVLAHLAVTSVVTLSLAGYLITREGTKSEDPFKSASFKSFSAAGHMQCTPMSNVLARCVDADGLVMLSSVMVSPESTMFSFSYGAQRVNLRVFNSAADAQRWKREPATGELAPNLAIRGRYVLFGTDPDRISAYLALLDDADPGMNAPAGKTTRTQANDALPARLASLTIGSLHLPDNPSQGTVSAAQEAAVRFVLGAQPATIEAPQVVSAPNSAIPSLQHAALDVHRQARIAKQVRDVLEVPVTHVHVPAMVSAARAAAAAVVVPPVVVPAPPAVLSPAAPNPVPPVAAATPAPSATTPAPQAEPQSPAATAGDPSPAPTPSAAPTPAVSPAADAPAAGAVADGGSVAAQ